MSGASSTLAALLNSLEGLVDPTEVTSAGSSVLFRSTAPATETRKVRYRLTGIIRFTRAACCLVVGEAGDA